MLENVTRIRQVAAHQPVVRPFHHQVHLLVVLMGGRLELGGAENWQILGHFKAVGLTTKFELKVNVTSIRPSVGGPSRRLVARLVVTAPIRQSVSTRSTACTRALLGDVAFGSLLPAFLLSSGDKRFVAFVKTLIFTFHIFRPRLIVVLARLGVSLLENGVCKLNARLLRVIVVRCASLTKLLL